MFLVNSRFSLVSAALPPSPNRASGSRPPFSRSYGGILPNSLTMLHSIALVFSTYPPESVWGTGGSNLARNFSWQHRITLLPAYAVTIKPRALMGRIYHSPALRSSTWTTIATRRLPSCVLPSLTYYQLGSRVPPPDHTPQGRAEMGGFRRLASPDSVWVGSSPVPEYQPDVHRLRLSASP